MKRYSKPHRLKRKKSFFANKFFLISFFLIFFIFIVIYFLFFHSFFQIKKIEIITKKNELVEPIKNLVLKKSEKKLFFLPTKSIFLISSKEISTALLHNFPQISQLLIRKRIPDRLILEIEEREPVAIFLFKEERLFIDREGIVFEKAGDENNLFTIKSEISPTNLEIGRKAVTKEQISVILDLKEKLREKFSIEIVEALIVSEERVNFKTKENWFIFFSFQNIDWQLDKLKVVLEKEIPKERLKNLEYIDLRFGNFAPYKYR